MELLEYPGGPCVGLHRSIVEEPSETSEVITKAHPMLIPLADDSTHHFDKSFYWEFTHALESTTVEKVSRSALPFQPPPAGVSFIYREERFFIKRAEGVTFGAIFDHLGQERKRCRKIVEKTAKPPHALSAVGVYEDAIILNAMRLKAIRLLEGPLRDDPSNCPRGIEEQYLYFSAEDAIMDDDREVSIARCDSGFTGF